MAASMSFQEALACVQHHTVSWHGNGILPVTCTQVFGAASRWPLWYSAILTEDLTHDIC